MPLCSPSRGSTLPEVVTMTLNEYQKAALQTAKYDHLPYDLQIAYLALQLSSEAGEVAAEFAKPWRKGTYFNEENIKGELGDVLWYVVNLAARLKIPLDDILTHNIDKLTKRYAS